MTEEDKSVNVISQNVVETSDRSTSNKSCVMPSESPCNSSPSVSKEKTIFCKNLKSIGTPQQRIFSCVNPNGCITLRTILESFKCPLSEEQAWALIYQFVVLFRSVYKSKPKHIFRVEELPACFADFNLHNDGSVHCSSEKLSKDNQQCPELAQNGSHNKAVAESYRTILRNIAFNVYSALDYNLPADEQCQMSTELENLITYMTAEAPEDDGIDEGIDDDDNEDEKGPHIKEFDFVVKACIDHVKPTVPDDHYRAVCRALVTESIELKVFLQQILNGTHSVHMTEDSQTSKQELAKLGFNDWQRRHQYYPK